MLANIAAPPAEDRAAESVFAHSAISHIRQFGTPPVRAIRRAPHAADEPFQLVPDRGIV